MARNVAQSSSKLKHTISMRNVCVVKKLSSERKIGEGGDSQDKSALLD